MKPHLHGGHQARSLFWHFLMRPWPAELFLHLEHLEKLHLSQHFLLKHNEVVLSLWALPCPRLQFQTPFSKCWNSTPHPSDAVYNPFLKNTLGSGEGGHGCIIAKQCTHIEDIFF